MLVKGALSRSAMNCKLCEMLDVTSIWLVSLLNSTQYSALLSMHIVLQSSMPVLNVLVTV